MIDREKLLTYLHQREHLAESAGSRSERSSLLMQSIYAGLAQKLEHGDFDADGEPKHRRTREYAHAEREWQQAQEAIDAGGEMP